MIGRYKTIIITAALVLFAATMLPAASNYIRKLDLAHEDGFTVLTIQGDGQLRTAHQSVVAKKGKPFRIVIDCLAARHNLPQKEYADLPKSIITSIRTSQYAVQPEEVVRVVLDIADETVYRVETEGNNIKVFVADSKTPAFAAWSSGKAKTVATAGTRVSKPTESKPARKPKVTVATGKTQDKKPSILSTKTQTKPAIDLNKVVLAEIPASEQQNIYSPLKQPVKKAKVPSVKKAQPTPPKKQSEQKLAATAPKAVENKSDAKSKTVTVAESTETKEKAPSTKFSKPVPIQDKQKSNQQQASTKPSAVKKTTTKQVASAPVETTQKQKQPTVVTQKATTQKATPEAGPKTTTDLAKKSGQQANIFAALETKNPPVPGREPSSVSNDKHKQPPEKKDTKAVAKDKPEPSKPKAPATRPTPVKEDKNEVLASADQPEPQKTTSRFRRQRAKATRMKQTQVVQFPMRIVTKYNSGGSRDPFKSLINEVGTHKGGFDLSRVPSVETLYLVGILESDKGKSSALLEDIDGIGYILKPGSRVKNGYVAQIDDQAVYFQINEYGWSRTIVKHMEKEN